MAAFNGRDAGAARLLIEHRQLAKKIPSKKRFENYLAAPLGHVYLHLPGGDNVKRVRQFTLAHNDLAFLEHPPRRMRAEAGELFFRQGPE